MQKTIFFTLQRVRMDCNKEKISIENKREKSYKRMEC